jgi:hypothetical protein
MPTTRRRFFNVQNAKHGLIDISTIQSITLRKSWTRLAAQGDADITDTFQAKTNLQVGGTLVIQDAMQADALLDAVSGVLTWQGQTTAGGQPKVETVDGVEFFSLDETDAHNAVDGITLGWNAFSPTGIDPASVALGT